MYMHCVKVLLALFKCFIPLTNFLIYLLSVIIEMYTIFFNYKYELAHFFLHFLPIFAF